MIIAAKAALAVLVIAHDASKVEQQRETGAIP
jgi:hypothetical protein